MCEFSDVEIITLSDDEEESKKSILDDLDCIFISSTYLESFNTQAISEPNHSQIPSILLSPTPTTQAISEPNHSQIPSILISPTPTTYTKSESNSSVEILSENFDQNASSNKHSKRSKDTNGNISTNASRTIPKIDALDGTPTNSFPSVSMETPTFNYYESHYSESSKSEKKSKLVRYKCEYENCDVVCQNNISYMFHLWSHCMNWHLDQRGGYPELWSCPDCLRTFTSPYRAQVHYSTVHGIDKFADVCYTCEKVITQAEHADRHKGTALPYRCSLCGYETSLRPQIIAHFMRFHQNTENFFCPFCLQRFVLLGSGGGIHTEKAYASHIWQHSHGITYPCDLCALRFLSEQELSQHKRIHSKRIKDLSSRFKEVEPKIEKAGESLHKFDELYCLECGTEIGNKILLHFRDCFTCRKCNLYETSCRFAWLHHQGKDCLRQKRGSLKPDESNTRVKCSKCDYTSHIIDIIEHLRKCDTNKGIFVEQIDDESKKKIYQSDLASKSSSRITFAVKESSSLAKHSSWLKKSEESLERTKLAVCKLKLLDDIMFDINDFMD